MNTASRSAGQRKHLISKEALAAGVARSGAGPLTGHRQGNGLRVHGIYFLAVSLVALALLVVLITVASAM